MLETGRAPLWWVWMLLVAYGIMMDAGCLIALLTLSPINWTHWWWTLIAGAISLVAGLWWGRAIRWSPLNENDADAL